MAKVISTSVSRVVPSVASPFGPAVEGEPWNARGEWPCRWIHAPAAVAVPWVGAFRCKFEWAGSHAIQLLVTADERYELFLDGMYVGRGPERGSRGQWHYDTYELTLGAGPHVLVAKVWSLGEFRAWGQASVRAGFLCCPTDAKLAAALGTGVAAWQFKKLEGFTFRSGKEQTQQEMGVGPAIELDAAQFAWGFETGAGEGWTDTVPGVEGNNGFNLYANAPIPWLTPSTLPPMRAERVEGMLVRYASESDASEPQPTLLDAALNEPKLRATAIGLLRGRWMKVAPKTNVRILVDIEDYLACRPMLAVSGGVGAWVSLSFAESLSHTPGGRDKGNRDEIDAKHFVGFGDRYLLDGADRVFEPLWWRSGRYIELRVRTGADAMTLRSLELRRTGYPLKEVAVVDVDDPRIAAILPVCRSGLLACMHEQYIDCPYYEQLSYIGDTRLQALAAYVQSPDDRLARKALSTFDASRANPTGLPTSNDGPAGQIIPGFALVWIQMLADSARYRGDIGTIRRHLPGARAVIDPFLATLDADGLHRSLCGWNYVDAGFPGGVPPGGTVGKVCVPVNLQLVLAMDDLASLEALCGEPELAARCRRHADTLFAAIDRTYRGPDGTISDDPDHQTFSEQTQALSILTGRLDAPRVDAIARTMLATPEGWTRCDLYFMHYLFEAAARCTDRSLGADLVFSRLEKWFEMLARGFRAFPESAAVTTRSDCHGWSSHPMFHVVSTLAGIRPDAMGFTSVRIAPMPGLLKRIDATIAHPSGLVRANLNWNAQKLHAVVTLPDGITGTLQTPTQTFPLGPGETTLDVAWT